MSLISKIDNFIYKVEKWLAILLGITLFGAIFIGVIYRSVLNSPLAWTSELAIFTMIWMTFIGGGMELKNKRYAAVSFFVDKLKPVPYKIVTIVGFIIAATFALFIISLSIIWLTSANISIQKSIALELPMIYPYLSVPVGFLFIFIHIINLIVEHFKEAKE